MSLDPETLAAITAAVTAALAANPTPKASQTAKAFPLAKVHPCTADKPCKRLSRTAEGAAAHLRANSPRNAKGHTPVR